MVRTAWSRRHSRILAWLNQSSLQTVWLAGIAAMNNERRIKRVVYLCPACKKNVVRRLDVAHRRYESVCESKGKIVKMKRLIWSWS